MTTELAPGGVTEDSAEFSFSVEPFDMHGTTTTEHFAVSSLLISHIGGRMPIRTEADLERFKRQEAGKDFFVARENITSRIIGVATGLAVIDEAVFEETPSVATTVEYTEVDLVIDEQYDTNLVEIALVTERTEWARRWGHSVISQL